MRAYASIFHLLRPYSTTLTIITAIHFLDLLSLGHFIAEISEALS